MRRDRGCRFPGCTNVTFTNVHHIVPWKPGGRNRPRQSGPALFVSPWGGAQEGVGDVGRRQYRELTFCRPAERPGHDLAPLAAVDEGDGDTQGRVRRADALIERKNRYILVLCGFVRV